MRCAVFRNCITRCVRSCRSSDGPRISASSPFALRRNASICHSRSCAVTYPCAKNRSFSLAASMCGTPCASRRTVTGAESPARCSSPSSTGSAAFSAERNKRTPMPAAIKRTARRVAADHSRMRGQRRLRRRGLETRVRKVDGSREPGLDICPL